MLTRRAVLSFALLPTTRDDAPPDASRLIAVLPLRGGKITALGFACNAVQSMQEVAALMGPDGTLLAVERLRFTSRGLHFSTRLAMMADREHIALTRQVLTTGRATLREAWTDYLRLTPSGLHDDPARTLTPGTFQTALSVQRADIGAMVKPGLRNVPPPVWAALRAPPF